MTARSGVVLNCSDHYSSGMAEIPTSRDEASDIFRAPPERHIDVGGGEVAYRRVGTGPDVLFSHGWPASGATFRHLLPVLAPHVTCHVIDHVGAGDSRFDRDAKISLTDHGRALGIVADELGLERFGVVGHDSGGMIARLGLAGDERVTGWGLIATEQPPKPHWRFTSFLSIRHLPRFERVIAWALNTPSVRRIKYVGGDIFGDRTLLDGEFDEFYCRRMEDPDAQWAVAQFARNFDLGLFAALTECHRKMTAPSVLVWGGNDPFFPVERTRTMMGEFAGPVDLHVIDDGKLFVHEEFPEEAADFLLPVLRG